MAWSTPDLSDITQVLKGLIETAINNSSLSQGNIKVYCDSPDTARQSDGNCHLSIYLLHVARDPYWRNTPVAGPRPQLNNAQPLSLNLSYLLTAWCDKDFTSEQRAMSIALQAFHSQPIVTQALIQAEMLSQWLPEGEFVVSIEPDTIEEISGIWQAFTVPMRLSALIRVSVVFIAPLAPMAPLAIPPSIANVSVAPEPVAATAPLLIAGFGQQSPPVPPGANPSQITATIGPLVAAGGSTVAIAGNGLDLPAAADVFLSVPGTATEWNVTSPWRQNTAAGELDLLLSSNYADPATSLPAPPAATPLPGLYNLTVGSGMVRSNAIPLIIAPRVDGVTNPPLLPPDASGLYTIAGAGFVPGTATMLSFGPTALAYSMTATPLAGQFTVNAAGTTISFLPPAAASAGSYPVLIAVNGLAASTGWVVVLS
jgi:hypothetical protein